MISSNSMLQTNVREGYRIITLEVVELIEDLISYYSAKVKIEDLSNTLTLILSKTAQRRSSSVMSNRSTASITNKFSVALLTKPAILNNANVALVDAVHYSVVIDALTMTLIKDDDDLLGTVNSYIKPPLKRCKTEAADSRHAKASRGRTKKDKDLENSNTSSDRLGKEAQLKKTRDEEELAKLDSLLDSDDYCLDSSLDIDSKDDLEDEEATIAKDLLIDAYILYFKELLSDNSGIFANAIGIGKTRAIVLATEVQNARAEGNAIEHNAVNDDDKLCPTKGKRTFYCANSPSENIGRLTKEEAIEMQIDTTNAIFKALAAANKLTILEANTPAVYSEATKHRLAPSAARFVIVCSFRKVDKHVFRAYNTISVIAYCLYLDFLSTVQNAEQQCRDILEKEGLNELEASRRVIFNCFEMQAIASYPALATLKAAQFKTYGSCKVKRFTLNSVKNLFTNLSKDYFLVREARAITKSSLNIAAEDAAKAANTLLPLKEVRAKILIGSYKLIVQVIIIALIAFAEVIILIEATHVVIMELQDNIIYFNLDSKLELKVLGKQDVKTTS
ncbi:hypothetical protein HBI18_106170 [Parastagonospora nodorum]|nr:hypothetical protein HBI18_106170 [Parastagonospora nodorum]